MTGTVLGAREDASALLTGTLTDEAGAAVPAAQLTTLTLTLYDKVTGSIINGRNAQNVLNANGVTVSAAGALAWTMDPLDNPIVTAGSSKERHVALFKWTYGAGKKGNAEVHVDVTDVPRL
jgi:hypothetical protein